MDILHGMAAKALANKIYDGMTKSYEGHWQPFGKGIYLSAGDKWIAFDNSKGVMWMDEFDNFCDAWFWLVSED